MLFSLSANTFAESRTVNEADLYAYIEEAIQFIRDMEAEQTRTPSRDINIGDGISQVQVTDLSLETAFEIFRVQLALDIGMDLDTFLLGDMGAWLNEYLYRWRRANGVTIISYEGPTAVTFDTDSGVYEVHSMLTNEPLYSFVRCDAESLILEKVSILRAPYTFYSRMNVSFDESAFIELIDSHLGIQSIDELLYTAPLSLLGSYMGSRNMAFADISVNWTTATSNDVISFDVSSSREMNAPIQAPTPAEAEHVLEAMAQYSIGAEEALHLLRGATSLAIYEEIAVYTAEVGIAPLFDFDPRHYRIHHTTANPYRSIVHIETTFGSATGFLISPNVVVTAGHAIYYQGRGWSSSVVVRPGRNGYWNPFGYRRNGIRAGTAWVGGGWVNHRDFGDDWAILLLDVPFHNHDRLWLAAPNDGDFLQNRNKRVVGYPGGHYMFANRGTVQYLLGHQIVATSNLSIGGYSGSPMFCNWGWVTAMSVAGWPGESRTWAFRITPWFINFAHGFI